MSGIGGPDQSDRNAAARSPRALLDRIADRFEPARDAEPGLKLWPLLAGIGLLFAVGIAAVAGAAWLAGREADVLATGQSVGQIEHAFIARNDALSTMNLDWAYWNEGIDKFVLHPNPDYADRNLGSYGHDTLGLHAVIVVGADDRPGFAYLDGERAAPEAAAAWLRQIAPLIERTRRESGEIPATASAYVILDGQLVNVAASAMRPEPRSDPIGWSQPPVLVFMQAIDAEVLGAIGDAAGVQNLAPASLDLAAPRKVTLPGPDGDTVAALSFDLRLPSTAIFTRLWPIEIIIALILMAIGAVIARRLLEMAARYQQERQQSEFALSNAMLEARAASHAKSQFLANMSHEIRTPLNGVIGYSEMLKLGYIGQLNPKQMEYVTSIETAGRHLLALLQDVLDLAKIEAGREDLDETDLDVESVVAKAVALVGPRARERGVSVVVESATPARLHADGRRVLQMLLNLLSNAIRFTPSMGAVRVGWGRKPDGRFALFVADGGPGIPEADLPHVAEPFRRRGDAAARRDGESNGLGLPLTDRLLGLHGGRLLLRNAVTGGLIAELQFPASRYLGIVEAGQTAILPRAAAR